jgi:hypothetical protein
MEDLKSMKIGDKSRFIHLTLTQLALSLDANPNLSGAPVIPAASVTDAADRFVLWAGSVDAMGDTGSTASLDGRLSATGSLREETHRQLDEMVEAISTCGCLSLNIRQVGERRTLSPVSSAGDVPWPKGQSKHGRPAPGRP